jgi:hypothetical protein
VEKHFQLAMNTCPKGDKLKLLGSYWLEGLTQGVDGLSLAVINGAAGM